MVNLNSVVATARDAQIAVSFQGFSSTLLPLVDIRRYLTSAPKVALRAASNGGESLYAAFRATAHTGGRRSLLEFTATHYTGAGLHPSAIPQSSCEIACGAAISRVMVNGRGPRYVEASRAVKARSHPAGPLSAGDPLSAEIPRSIPFLPHMPILSLKPSYYRQAVKNIASAAENQRTGDASQGMLV